MGGRLNGQRVRLGDHQLGAEAVVVGGRRRRTAWPRRAGAVTPPAGRREWGGLEPAPGAAPGLEAGELAVRPFGDSA
jgi:hypothetical protein